jgi:exodeoxyribonuclease I
MKTFLFYDLETSGLNKAFDQVMQFAAIRTDENLNEIERHEELVKLNPDVIPSPHALITHRISIQQARQGLCEYEAIHRIHEWINNQNTISIGYNTLGFDDEFLRFSFYKNLLPPYSHQYANGCGRIDLYPMATMYYLFQHDVIDWPLIDGKSTLKLEQLSLKNNLAIGMAHDAMVDVEATIALAKKFKSKSEMWNYLCGYFDKETDIARSIKLPIAFANYQLALLVDGSFGANNKYHSAALSLGNHYHYRNQTLWLRLDDPKLLDATKDNFNETAWMTHKKIGGKNLILPFTDRFTKHIDSDRQTIINENMLFLKSNSKLLHEISEYHRNYTYPTIPDLDVDAALYQNDFPTNYETQLCNDFHIAPINKKYEVINRMLNQNLKTQMIRVLARNYPEYLPEKYKDEFETFIEDACSNKPITDYRGQPRMTIQQAQFDINNIEKNNMLDEQQKKILCDAKKELTQYGCVANN